MVTVALILSVNITLESVVIPKSWLNLGTNLTALGHKWLSLVAQLLKLESVAEPSIRAGLHDSSITVAT